MQSDFAVFCRAVIMLSALVGLPFLAIWGLDRPMPPFVAGLIDRCRSLADGKDPGGPPAAVVDAESSDAARSSLNRPAAVPWASGDRDGPPPLASSGSAVGEMANGSARAGWPDGVRQASVTTDEIAGQTELEAEQQIEQRLRRLGAGRYLLEKWGDGQGLYRFHCEVPFLQEDGFHRQFEAVDESRLSAMRRVLQQVESWRTARAEQDTRLR